MDDPHQCLERTEVILRVVTQADHVGINNGTLTEQAVLRDDLAGKIGNDGKPRSFSMVMLCRCTEAELSRVISVLRGGARLPEDAGGAACAVGVVQDIERPEGQRAFDVQDDPDPNVPHHVSVRFCVNTISKGEQRRLRQRLIDVLGAVSSINNLRSTRCSGPGIAAEAERPPPIIVT